MTSFKDQLKEEVRTERRKMKEMSLQDRLWYIWEYYKFHIGAVLIVILLVNVAASSLRNASIDPGLYCVIINSRSSQELDTAPLEQDFFHHMGFGKKQPVYVESMYISYGDDATEYSYASMAKISALVAARDLDVIIGDAETLSHYGSLDGMADLTSILPPDVLSQVEGRLSTAPDGAGRSVAVSVDISGTSLAERMHLSEEAANLGIVNNSGQRDHAVALIRYIFGLQGETPAS